MSTGKNPQTFPLLSHVKCLICCEEVNLKCCFPSSFVSCCLICVQQVLCSLPQDSQNWAGSQSHLISWGKWTPKSESRAASWRRYQGRQIRSLQGDRRKKNLPQKRRGLGDREPAKERAPECTTQNHPDSLLTLHGMWHQSGASTPAQHGKKGPTTLQLQILGEGLVIQSVQVLTDWILSDRKISSICGNF